MKCRKHPDRDAYCRDLCKSCYNVGLRTLKRNEARALKPIKVRPTGCGVAGCAKPHASEGLCRTHFSLQSRAAYEADPNSPRCSEPECDNVHYAKGVCRMHYGQNWRTSNKDDTAESYRLWAQANRDVVRAKNATRRAREAAAEGVFTAADIQDLFLRCARTCQRCLRTDAEMTIDHIIPLKRGGTNWPYNLTLLCRKCNSSKRDRVELWVWGELVFSDIGGHRKAA